MCDPASAAMGMMAAGTAVSAAGAIQSSQAEADALRESAELRAEAAAFEGKAINEAAQRNADLRLLEADQELQLAKVEEQSVRRKTERDLGQQVADLAASGRDVQSQTSIMLAFDSAREGEIAALNVRTRGQLRAAALTREAEEFRARGTDAITRANLAIRGARLRSEAADDVETAGFIGAGTRLLRGGSRIAMLA